MTASPSSVSVSVISKSRVTTVVSEAPVAAPRPITAAEAFQAAKTYNTSCLKRYIRQQLQRAAATHTALFRGGTHAESHYYSAVLTSERDRDAYVQSLAKADVAALLSLPLALHPPSPDEGGQRGGASASNGGKSNASAANTANGDDKGSTLLHWACYSGSQESAELLIAFGADPNAQEADGKTPLHWAAFEGHEDICRFLLSMAAEGGGGGGATNGGSGAHHRVDYMLLSEDDSRHRLLTPCHLAVINRHMDVAQLFPNYWDVISKADASSAPVEIVVGPAEEVPVELVAPPPEEPPLSSVSDADEGRGTAEEEEPPAPPPPEPALPFSPVRPVMHDVGVLTSRVASSVVPTAKTRSPSSSSSSSAASSSSSSGEERRRRRRRREEKRRKKRERQQEKEAMLKQLIHAINAATLAKEQMQQQKEALLAAQRHSHEAELHRQQQRLRSLPPPPQPEPYFVPASPITIRWGGDGGDDSSDERVVLVHQPRAVTDQKQQQHHLRRLQQQQGSQSQLPIDVDAAFAGGSDRDRSQLLIGHGSFGGASAAERPHHHDPLHSGSSRGRWAEEADTDRSGGGAGGAGGRGAHEGSLSSHRRLQNESVSSAGGRGQQPAGDPANASALSYVGTASSAGASTASAAAAQRATPTWSHFFDGGRRGDSGAVSPARRQTVQQQQEASRRLSAGVSPSRARGGAGGDHRSPTAPTRASSPQGHRLSTHNYGSGGRPPWRPPSKVNITADVRAVAHGPLATEAQIALSQARARDAAAVGGYYGQTLNVYQASRPQQQQHGHAPFSATGSGSGYAALSY